MASMKTKSNLPRVVGRILKYLVLLIYAVFTLVPLLWMFSASVKPLSEVLTVPTQWIPRTWQFQNFGQALFQARFSGYNLAKFFGNSLLVALLTTLISTGLCISVGYAFAKFQFRGRETLMWVILGSTLLPLSSVLIPLYVIVRKLGMTDTLASLVVPFLLTGQNIFLARQFLLSIPGELLDAARVDGASEWRIFRTIVLPISRPIAATLAIMTYIFSWNNFTWPLVVIESQSRFTLPLGLSLLGIGSTFLVDYHLWMAASSMAILPAIILFLILNKHYLSGMETLSGLKS